MRFPYFHLIFMMGMGLFVTVFQEVDVEDELTSGRHGEIRVLHATPEQLAQLQQAHQIQILQGDQVVQVSRFYEFFTIV